jgi:UDP-N-acetylglucosamine--N-acetylmuramyl-(pentapeptide) pyrophosphoryl-undecaprenol N-acetylglucosamine transferase
LKTGGIVSERTLRIVIAGGGTGGHVQPAIAVADVLREKASVQLTWIGSSTGVESESAAQRSIPFRSIPTGKLRRYFSLQTFTDAFRIPVGVARARLHLRDMQPDVIFSTGGFVSVPTVIAGWLAGIPIITHEQTATVGLANKINARIAVTVALAYQETARLIPFANERIIITGNPVRAELLEGNAERAREQLGLPSTLPVLYVTGGSLGAQAVNAAIRSLIPTLVEEYSVVHQCGPAAMNGDYPRLLETRSELPEHLRDRYVVRERIGAELADIYALADLVVGRSGGGTVAELAMLGKPAIFIPLPGTASDEQTRNARVLAESGGATILPQVELSPERLQAHIDELLGDPERLQRMSGAARTVAQPDAASKLADAVLKLARR